MSCRYGICTSKLPNGSTCTSADQCFSGSCSPFYRDADADTWGDAQSQIRACGTTAPSGYVMRTGDCCDDGQHAATAALIYPGAGFQLTSANVCDIVWDYDCSEEIEKAATQVSCGGVLPYDDEACGTTVPLSWECAWVNDPGGGHEEPRYVQAGVLGCK